MDLERYFEEFTDRDWQDEHVTGRLRVAMIGLGWWTREQAIPAVEKSERCTTTVVVSSSTGKAEAVADGHGTIEHAITYDEYHEGVAADAYDAVYVCTPNALHLPYVETAAELGKAVLCEKPMEASLERAERIVEVCADHDVPLMVAYRMQTEPAVRRMRELIADGFVGDPVLVHGHMSQVLLKVIPDPDQWRLDPDLAGYGSSVMDLGVYPINTARFVLDADPVAVLASAGGETDAFAEVPDEAAVFTVEFDSGVRAACSASQNAHHSSFLRVTGTEGEIELDPAFYNRQQRSLTLSRAGTTASHPVERVDQMEEEFEYFAGCVLSGERPHPDGEHGLVDMATVKAIYESVDSGGSVPVER